MTIYERTEIGGIGEGNNQRAFQFYLLSFNFVIKKLISKVILNYFEFINYFNICHICERQGVKLQ